MSKELCQALSVREQKVVENENGYDCETLSVNIYQEASDLQEVSLE